MEEDQGSGQFCKADRKLCSRGILGGELEYPILQRAQWQKKKPRERGEKRP